MQTYNLVFVGLLALFNGANAVVVCSGFNAATGGCENPCTNFDISLGEIIETPGTNCIFNSDTDPGFDLRICSGADLSGPCSDLGSAPRVDITGDFNWHTPNTNSIERTGN
jgi:hypothetical protein